MSIKQGEYLKKLRNENKLSQEQLAEKLGVSRQSISKWEQGISTPDIDNFVKLSELYSVSVDSMLKGEELNEARSVAYTDKKPEKKKPIIFCYPVLVLILFLLCGFFLKLWHPMWIIFLTIPLFYIITAKKK